MKTIKCPTLLLRGEHSKVVTEEIARRMATEMADCRLGRIDNAGHALFTEQPSAFADRVGEFIGAGSSRTNMDHQAP